MVGVVLTARRGVWNSRKSREWRKSRMYLMMWDRRRRVSTDLRLVSRSMWRLWKRRLWSRTWKGRGTRDGERSSGRPVARMVSSPVDVRVAFPLRAVDGDC